MTNPNPPSGEMDLSPRVAHPFMVGVYLAVNAIRDLYLLVEGPDCTYMKTQYVQGNHDWLSTLTSVSGTHRIANTALHPSEMSASREEALRALLAKMASKPAVPAVALTSMPMAFVTGADYERLVREVWEATGTCTLHIPGRSLSRDWLDGYAETLVALATQLNLQRGKLEQRTVGIVGYLLDRNEADHSANLCELKETFAALGLKLGCVWLCGGRFADLRRIEDAGTIVALPYGRRAARQIARRTGARLVELPAPFGLEQYERWVRRLGDLLDCRGRAEAYVSGRLAEIVPRLEWVVPFVFQNRTVGYIGDPHLLEGIKDLVTTVGARLSYAVLTNRDAHLTGLPPVDFELLPNPRMKQLVRFVLAPERKVDLLITHNAGIVGTDAALLEFGFPSSFRHALYDRPFLGFGGALSFIDLMANALRMREAELAIRKLAQRDRKDEPS